MLAIPIDDKWVETAKLFGDVKSVMEEALRAYSIEQCRQHINNASSKIAHYSEKYGCDYTSFKESIQTDENFLKQIESEYPLWEEDAMEWESWLEEKQTWRDRLEAILQS